MTNYQPIQLGDNLYIDHASFTSYNHAVVHSLLAFIDINMSRCRGIRSFSSKLTMVQFHEDGPMICECGTHHQIYLNVKGNYWCQWTYQFAHEYCHHLIGGKLTGNITGLKWFEECICELSSLFNLKSLANVWQHSSKYYQLAYTQAIQAYLQDLYGLQADASLSFPLAPHQKLVEKYATLLQEPRYHRDLYGLIAQQMLPFFEENPFLWQMILHFGDMEQWHSLHDLFRHLQDIAAPCYKHSLLLLQDSLL